MLLAHDQNARVKVSAINTITKCLDLVRSVPRSDANIFPEYILPGLAPLATDPNTCVRAAYAQNIATLAEISLRYLEQSQTDLGDKTGMKQREVSFSIYLHNTIYLSKIMYHSTSSLIIL